MTREEAMKLFGITDEDYWMPADKPGLYILKQAKVATLASLEVDGKTLGYPSVEILHNGPGIFGPELVVQVDFKEWAKGSVTGRVFSGIGEVNGKNMKADVAHPWALAVLRATAKAILIWLDLRQYGIYSSIEDASFEHGAATQPVSGTAQASGPASSPKAANPATRPSAPKAAGPGGPSGGPGAASGLGSSSDTDTEHQESSADDGALTRIRDHLLGGRDTKSNTLTATGATEVEWEAFKAQAKHDDALVFDGKGAGTYYGLVGGLETRRGAKPVGGPGGGPGKAATGPEGGPGGASGVRHQASGPATGPGGGPGTAQGSGLTAHGSDGDEPPDSAIHTTPTFRDLWSKVLKASGLDALAAKEAFMEIANGEAPLPLLAKGALTYGQGRLWEQAMMAKKEALDTPEGWA